MFKYTLISETPDEKNVIVPFTIWHKITEIKVSFNNLWVIKCGSIAESNAIHCSLFTRLTINHILSGHWTILVVYNDVSCLLSKLQYSKFIISIFFCFKPNLIWDDFLLLAKSVVINAPAAWSHIYIIYILYTAAWRSIPLLSRNHPKHDMNHGIVPPHLHIEDDIHTYIHTIKNK